jgi:hypothetical protein
MSNPNAGRRDEGRFSGTSQFGTESRKQESASGIAERAKDTASSVAEQARSAASSAAHTARDVASQAGQKAEDATSSVGSGMQSLASSLRDKGPHEGMMGTATSRVADSLDSGGRYLQEHGLSGLGDDLTNLIRRNPIPAVLIGFGVGFLIARSMRS